MPSQARRSPGAIIVVRTPSGAVRSFQADSVSIDHNGLVTATGIWRGTKDRRRRTYVWSAGQLLEIRCAETVA